MYSTDGAFGKIRAASPLPIFSADGLISLQWVGWHRCNDLYEICRPDGCDRHLLLFTADGEGELILDGTKHTLTPGTAAFLPRRIPHHYRTPAGGIWEFYWLHPELDFGSIFLDTLAEKGVYVKKTENLASYKSLCETLLRLCRRQGSDTPLRISQKMSEILHMAALDFSTDSGTDSLSDRIIEYIEKHFRKPFRLEQMAEELFVSPEHMIRTFKKATGYTPHRYLLNRRLLAAAELLKFSEKKMDAIAAELGFSTPSHFIAAFHRKYGCTPTQYRNSMTRH